MTTQIRAGTPVIHKVFGTGIVQPINPELHPNLPEDVVFVKFDVIPTVIETGDTFSSTLVQVFADTLVEV